MMKLFHMTMKLSIAPFACLSGARAFSPLIYLRQTKSLSAAEIRRDARLFQSSTLGFETQELYTREELELKKKQDEVYGFLAQIHANKEPTGLRNLGTSVLISGFDPEEPASVEILNLLNNEDSPHFPFTKIVAHVKNMKVAKKRLIGRNARYTGLLDKLDFSEGTALPTIDQLTSISSWVVHIDGGDMSKLADIAELAETTGSVQNVAILVSDSQSVGVNALKAAEKMLQSKATSFAYTLLVVPEWNDEPEATCAFGIVNVTDLAKSPFFEGETFSREESLRIITECLAIDKASGKCVVANAAKETSSLEHMMILSMREIGFNRLEEVEQMITSGVKGYNDLVTAREAETTAAWAKAPEPTEEDLAARQRTREEAMQIQKQKFASKAKKEEIDKIALAWAKKEYLRKSLKRRIPMKENEFVEVIWIRALFEADLKWRTMQGQAVNESEERKQFREEQEKKRNEAFKAEKERWSKMQYDDVSTG